MPTRILIGDAVTRLAELPDASIHCCVTSPPYFGLRDYGVEGQIGLEASVADYVAKLVAVFREVKRVLRDDGTVWLNLGDSYSAHGSRAAGKELKYMGDSIADRKARRIGVAKQLLGAPWRVAFALQADGWILRQDIIWHKPNPMPESVRDRCTKSHEYVFLLAKSPRYYFDADAIATPCVASTVARLSQPNLDNQAGSDRVPGKTNGAMKACFGGRQKHAGYGTRIHSGNEDQGNYIERGANRRSVWKISTRSYKGAHFAVFPPDLVEPCILAGTSEFGCCASCGTPFRRTVAKTRVPTRPGTESTKSPDPQRHVTTTVTTGSEPGCKCPDTGRVPATVLDPFGGSGTTAQVAQKHGRDAILIELNPAYLPLIEARIGGAA